MVDLNKKGKVTIGISVGLPAQFKPEDERPKGGTYNRLTKLLSYKRETWDDVITRLLDFAESHGGLNNAGNK